MVNKLLINERARHHIKMFPMSKLGLDLPEDEGDKIRWCENQFKKLQHADNAKRLVIYKNKAKGYMISVWQMGALYYLIQCIRNEFKTFNDTIYISDCGEDLLSIAKFLEQNIIQIMADYKEQILEARNQLLKESAIPNKSGENHDS